ncbi:MAG: VOC family protein [Bacteroidota bacterium]
MKALVPYLVFPGNCKEAMKFYKNVFGGEIRIMMTFEESPINVPDDSGSRIFNSEMVAENITLKASDDMPGYEVESGNTISLYVTFIDVETKIEKFNKLSEGGKVQFPIEDNFGMVKDKYGIQWMVVHEE